GSAHSISMWNSDASRSNSKRGRTASMVPNRLHPITSRVIASMTLPLEDGSRKETHHEQRDGERAPEEERRGLGAAREAARGHGGPPPAGACHRAGYHPEVALASAVR